MQVGLKYGLPLLSPVDDAGVFTEEAGRFKGLQVCLCTHCGVVIYLIHKAGTSVALVATCCVSGGQCRSQFRCKSQLS